MSDVLSTLGNYATPQTVLGGLGLGLAAARGNQAPKGEAQLQTQANLLGTQGAQLLGQGTMGALPPSATALLDQQQNAADAAVRSSYSQMGLGGSTMESQSLQSNADQRLANSYQMLQGMIADGTKMTGMSAQILGQIMQTNTQGDDAFQKAIGSFVAGLAGAA